MTSAEPEQGPGLIARSFTAVMGHSQQWGMVWFGLIFWGSVLNAVGTKVWPNAHSVALGAAAAVLGLTAGWVAKVRGRWI